MILKTCVFRYMPLDCFIVNDINASIIISFYKDVTGGVYVHPFLLILYTASDIIIFYSVNG